jgi:ABC-type multidrug transport system fused ATPase/permease subunit
MESLANSEVFFVIAGIALIVVSVALLIILFSVIYILHQARKIASAVKKEMIHVIDDVEALRVAVKDKAKTVSSLISVASGIAVIKKFASAVHESKEKSSPDDSAVTK